jgi:hypothetical protein
MTDDEGKALEFAKSVLADAEQFRFASVPLPVAILRTLIGLAEVPGTPEKEI